VFDLKSGRSEQRSTNGSDGGILLAPRASFVVRMRMRRLFVRLGRLIRREDKRSLPRSDERIARNVSRDYRFEGHDECIARGMYRMNVAAHAVRDRRMK
jgi:hypothetical protein